MTRDLKRICILSGPREIPEVDSSRARAGIEYYYSLNVKVPFIILGAGPDLGEAVGLSNSLRAERIGCEEYHREINDLNHHLELYRILTETGEDVETVTSSTNLVENVLHGFRGRREGRYAIATDEWHYGKFEKVQRSLKKMKMIPGELEFFNIPPKDGIEYYSQFQKAASGLKTRLGLIALRFP